MIKQNEIFLEPKIRGTEAQEGMVLKMKNSENAGNLRNKNLSETRIYVEDC